MPLRSAARFLAATALAALAFSSLPAPARADPGEWPTYRADPARSGYTAEPLRLPLTLRWEHRSPHPPVPAWPASDRLRFDGAYQVVIASGRLFYASSADDQVRALDASTGELLWSVFTAGPVRFAPAAWRDRVFVASDDGHLWCLSARDGAVLWKKRGGPGPSMVLGNDRMISRWPARGGPVVAEGRVFFAAGIWPSETVFLHALDPETGDTVWVNDRASGLEMDQPHGGARARSGTAAQGYLAVAEGHLLVPTGRAVPAAFCLADGELHYFHLQRYGQQGGSALSVLWPYFHSGGTLFEAATGEAVLAGPPGPLAALPGGLAWGGGGKAALCEVMEVESADRKGRPLRVKTLAALWSVEGVPAGGETIGAGDLMVTGGAGGLAALDAGSGQAVWSQATEDPVLGLAAAGGRLYASTGTGRILCFGEPLAQAASPTGAPGEPAAPAPVFTAAAEEIIATAGITEGYCLDLGAGDGSLALELARRTRLQVIALDPEPAQVHRARERLAAAGLYGVRVTVHEGDPANTPYPRHVANLIVSGRSVLGGQSTAWRGEIERLLHPWGGVACLGPPGAMAAETRGPLPGAGQWTHQYGDAANTCSSGDELIKGRLGVLWFRDADLRMPQRHGRGPAPLFHEGRLFVEGLQALRAVDAYNGRTLWELPLPGILAANDQDHLMGTAGTHSNLCASRAGVFVHDGKTCLRLDPATGKKLAEYRPPPGPGGEPGTWGYLAVTDTFLFGSLADTAHLVKWRYLEGDMSRQFTESLALFALDLESAGVLWQYRAKHSIRHNAIAVGGGRVYLIDRPAAVSDRLVEARDEPQPPGELVALDAATGEEIWRRCEDIYGTLLALSVEEGVLVMGYQPTRFRLPSERGGRLSAFHAADGYRLWDRTASYASRPILNLRTIYAQGGAWDLLGGDERPFPFQRSYGCGILAGSRHLMVFRSATMGYFDLRRMDQGTQSYGGLRLGCWINAIPAGGIVLVPDAAAGCACSYLNRASLALGEVE